jgi:hypothetical protein
LDFSLSFCPRHPPAWPAAFQVIFKNDAESSLFELLRDVFSKKFQSSMPFVWFLMFIPFTDAYPSDVSSFPLYGMRLLYADMEHVKNTFYADAF